MSLYIFLDRNYSFTCIYMYTTATLTASASGFTEAFPLACFGGTSSSLRTRKPRPRLIERAPELIYLYLSVYILQVSLSPQPVKADERPLVSPESAPGLFPQGSFSWRLSHLACPGAGVAEVFARWVTMCSKI